MCEHRSHWAAADDAGLRGGLTTDLIREGLRRQLEQLFEKEQSVTKTIANVGDGSSRGLTPATSTRDNMRFSSDERRQLRQMSPRVEPSPQEACYSARQECRYFSEKPIRRARSLTPDHDVKSRFSPGAGIRSHAAGVASNSPNRWDAPGGLNDLSGRRLHARAKANYSNNGTSLPGSPRFERGCSEERTTATTSKSVKETLRFFLDKQDCAPERVGVRMQPGRTLSLETTPDAPQAFTTSKSVKESLRFFLDTQDSAPERVGVRMQPVKTLLGSERPASSSAQPTPRGSLRHSKLDIVSRERKDDACKTSSASSSSRLPSRDPSCSSLPSSRAAKRVVGRSYMPGCQDSNIALRLGTRAASAGKRDLWGRDKFEAGLRS